MRLIITDRFHNKVTCKPCVNRHGITFNSAGVFEKLRGMTFMGRIVGSEINIGICPIKDGIVTIPWDKIF